MAPKAYSFIDIAVLDEVRERFARGEALMILDESLEQLLWANGPGASLLGYSDVIAATGGEAGLGPVARRQIAALPGFPQLARPAALSLRLGRGQLLTFSIEGVSLPGADYALLLAQPATKTAERAAAAISGIAGEGQAAAIIDEDARPVAASEGFEAMGITPATLRDLVRDVGRETDRLIKRKVAGIHGAYPAAIARLTDDPVRHLMVVVDDPLIGRDEARSFPAPASVPTNEAVIDEPELPLVPALEAIPDEPEALRDAPDTVSDAGADTARYGGDEPQPIVLDEPEEPIEVVAKETVEVALDDTVEVAFDNAGVALDDHGGEAVLHHGDEVAFSDAEEAALGNDNDEVGVLDTIEEPLFETIEPPPLSGASNATGVETSPETAGDAVIAPEDAVIAPETIGGLPPDLAAELAAWPEIIEELPPPPPSEPLALDRTGPPIRFVWRTDPDGHFSSMSEEFAQAVGAPAADVVGRSFRDVATVFGVDHDGEVAGLLERRDTWSGRTVWWPIAGTDMQAPVDLAALPVYDKDRNFEGFRGFGVVRGIDIRPDPERIGLSLTPEAIVEYAPVEVAIEPPAPRFETPVITPDAPAAEPAKPEDDPFRGEVPALQIASKSGEQPDDKVVRLSERRHTGLESNLSSVERQAFREIGERLRREQKHEAPKIERLDVQANAPSLRHVVPETIEPAPIQTPDVPERRTWRDSSSPRFSEPAADTRPTSREQPRDIVSPEQNDLRDLRALDEEPARADTRPLNDYADIGVRTPARADTSILDQLPVPVLIHAGDNLHYANPEFLRLTGYETLAELEMAGGLDELFVESYHDVETRHELRMRNKAGEEFPAEALLRTAPWAGGKALMLVVRQTGEAVLAGTPTSEDLRQRLAEMRTIIDTATDGVILVDQQGAIRSISHPAEALFGFDSDEVKGKPLVSLFDVPSQDIVRGYLENLSLGGVASVLNDGREVVGREAEGRSVPLFMTMGRLPGDGGFCAVVRDITPWKKAEDELTKARTDAERASAQKSDFLARISHEIRTPLNAIIGFSELMVDEKFGPISNDRYRDYLRDINRSGNHVLDLVNDLLDLSKIEAGQQEMSYEAVSLNDALAEAVGIMQPQANRERVIIRASFAPRLPDIVADLRSIRQIALNILSNAVRYTQAGGQVVISTAYEKNGSIAMRVRDTGVGMNQVELEQAMKPFQQINALKRARGDGTGLGLPLTKALVEANRARFAISSKPGEGTLVEITFPSTRVLAQ